MAERRDAIQGELFSQQPVVLRRLPGSGTIFRLRLEALGHGMVRIVEAARRRRGTELFEDVPGERGRVMRFEQLGLDTDYETLFGRGP
jgi:hypothetical protein